jgi:predicted transcriptional regulator
MVAGQAIDKEWRKFMVATMTTDTVKQRARALIEALPDSAGWSDVLYALELAADIQQGLRDANAGLLTDSDAVRRELGLAN